MPRKKRMTREKILRRAFKHVRTKGFSKFTALSISRAIGCSTQPIYVEFESLEDLRTALLDRVYEFLEKEVYPVVHTGDPIIDLSLNYIEFAEREPTLFHAMFLETQENGRMHRFSYNYFAKILRESAQYQHLTTTQVESLLHGIWVTATGVANLTTSGFIQPTQEQKIQLISDAVRAICGMDHTLELSHHFL